MSHFPNLVLKLWKRDDKLAAQDLNGNFQALQGAVETAMAKALEPDPASVSLEVLLARLESRVADLEVLAMMHERQRNEKEWAPLAYLAEVLKMVEQLTARVEALERSS